MKTLKRRPVKMQYIRCDKNVLRKLEKLKRDWIKEGARKAKKDPRPEGR